MSSVDTFNHAHVGYFCNIPIYWVLEEVRLNRLTDNNNDYSKVINQYFLSIGGGSGEHPALIIKNDAAIYHFMKSMEEVSEPEIDSNESEKFDYEMYLLSEKIHNKFLNGEDAYNEICDWKFDKNQWSLNSFMDVGKVYEHIPKDLETIIMNAMALFIIHEMPLESAIQDKDLLEFAKMVKSNRWANAFDNKTVIGSFKGFSGVLNCKKHGRIIRNNTVVWGYSLTDWLNDQN